jgi:hypothetical protein
VQWWLAALVACGGAGKSGDIGPSDEVREAFAHYAEWFREDAG